MSQKLHIVVLACQQAVPEPAMLKVLLEETGLQARIIAEPCSSKIEVFQMLRILASEADLLWVLGCPEDLCLFTEGSFRMGRRVDFARKYLEEIRLETERLGMSRIPPGDQETLYTLAAEINQQAMRLGPNPARPGAPAGKE
jgi:coenzyme F420-reducing hydrogenase delta subunit